MTNIRALELPAQVAQQNLSDSVEIWEMAPRDGIQAEHILLSTDTRVELITRLAEAGLSTIEVGSFVRPDRVPAMKNSADVLDRVRHLPIRAPVLVPNIRGYELARDAGATDIAVFLSVTESFSRSNLGASRADMEKATAAVVRRAQTDDVRVRGYLSMVFGDPWEGAVDVSEVVRLATVMHSWGIHELSLGDTIGVATPGQVKQVVRALTDAGIDTPSVALHMHDTYGQALVNVYAGLEAGVRIFDASAGGVGGCPFAQSATGNLATDNLVWMLEGLGIHTGVELEALAETSAWLCDTLLKQSPSAVTNALRQKVQGDVSQAQNIPTWLHNAPLI